MNETTAPSYPLGIWILVDGVWHVLPEYNTNFTSNMYVKCSCGIVFSQIQKYLYNTILKYPVEPICEMCRAALLKVVL